MKNMLFKKSKKLGHDLISFFEWTRIIDYECNRKMNEDLNYIAHE